MLINKHNLNIDRFSGKENMTYAYDCLRMEKGETAATDGQVLAVCTAPDINEKDFFDTGVGGDPIVDGVSVPLNAISKVKRNIPKGKVVSTKPILSNVQVHAIKDTDEIALTTTDIETIDTVKTKTIDKAFPDYNKYAVKKEKYEEWGSIVLEAEQLEIIGKAYKEFKDYTDLKTVQFYINPDKEGANVYVAHNKDTGQDLVVYQMPRKKE